MAVGRAITLEGSNARNIVDGGLINNNICELLDGIGSGGFFVSSGVYNEAPLPDLCLEDFGPIPLPLGEDDAEALTRQCTKDDEGRRSLTVRDLGNLWLRKSMTDNAPRIEEYPNHSSGFQEYLPKQWVANPQSFDIRNPAWSKFVEMVAIKVSKDIGIKPDPGSLEASMTSVHLWASGDYLPPSIE